MPTSSPIQILATLEVGDDIEAYSVDPPVLSPEGPKPLVLKPHAHREDATPRGGGDMCLAEFEDDEVVDLSALETQQGGAPSLEPQQDGEPTLAELPSHVATGQERSQRSAGSPRMPSLGLRSLSGSAQPPKCVDAPACPDDSSQNSSRPGCTVM